MQDFFKSAAIVWIVFIKLIFLTSPKYFYFEKKNWKFVVF